MVKISIATLKQLSGAQERKKIRLTVARILGNNYWYQYNHYYYYNCSIIIIIISIIMINIIIIIGRNKKETLSGQHSGKNFSQDLINYTLKALVHEGRE